MQQPRDGVGGHLDPPAAQGLGQFPHRAVRPQQAGHKIASRGIVEQTVQGPQHPGTEASIGWRPAPAWRMRPGASRSWPRSSRSPRNGVAIQAGDTRHQGDATIPLLLGQQGDQLATTMLISPSDQSVDGAMVLCRDAVRMLSAGRARAVVQFVAVHRCSTVALPRSSRASTDTTGRPLVFQATVPGLCPLRAA